MSARLVSRVVRGVSCKASVALVLVIAAATLGTSCRARDRVQQEVAYLVGMQEYVYGFPLVMMDVTREVMTASATSGEHKAPINQFARLRAYVDPDFKDVVRISVNSLWSHGFLDLDAEPLIVSVPDMKDRYTVVQALNMWTDVFGSAGTRTNGGKAGRYLIAGPKWNGTAPKDITETFRSSTRYAWVLIQMSASSPKDYPEIHALQDQVSITPLSAWGKPYTPPATVPVNPNVDLTATPFDQVRLMTGATFFARLAKALADNPPYAKDATVGADKETNWLPCPPSGSFNLTIRSYQPKESLLNGSYVLPPVRKVS